MKKLVLLNVMLTVLMAAGAQNDSVVYKSVFGDSSAAWYIHQVGSAVNGTGVYETHVDDTLSVDGNKYMICRITDNYSSFPVFCEDPQLLREDERHSKLYLRQRWMDYSGIIFKPEIMIMDLDLEVGDTLETSNWSDLEFCITPLPVPKIMIDSIYYTPDGRKVLRTDYYREKNYPGIGGYETTLLFIEGVGPSWGPLYARHAEHYMLSLMCFYQDNAAIYHGKDYYDNSSDRDCIIEVIIDGISISDTTPKKVVINQNPTQGLSRIKFQQKTGYRIMVISQDGKVVERDKGYGTFADVDLRNHPAGVYHISLITDNNIQTLKIVKL